MIEEVYKCVLYSFLFNAIKLTLKLKKIFVLKIKRFVCIVTRLSCVVTESLKP